MKIAGRRRQAILILVLLVPSLAMVAGCKQASTYSDDLVRAAQAFMTEVKPVGQSVDDIAALARRSTTSDEAAAALLRALAAPPRTLSSRVDDTIARLTRQLGLDASQDSAIRAIIVDATCESIGAAVGTGEDPDFASALAGAVAARYSQKASAQQLADTVADIWQDVETRDVLGLSIIASVTLCSEAL